MLAEEFVLAKFVTDAVGADVSYLASLSSRARVIIIDHRVLRRGI
jgi:hypothetical protein